MLLLILISVFLSIIIGYFSGWILGVVLFVSFVAGILVSNLHFFRTTLSTPFFTGKILRKMLDAQGIESFRNKIIEEISELQEYQFFIIRNNSVAPFPQENISFTSEMISNMDIIFQKAQKTPLFISPEYKINFTKQHRQHLCYAYAYNVPLFNSRVLVLTHFSQNIKNIDSMHEKIKKTNDMLSMLLFFSEISEKQHNVIDILNEVGWDSPYAWGISSPKGELVLGNNALYQLFRGSIPNFLELTNPEVFLLLLDGKKIGKTFHHDGQTIHLEAFPLHNKNFLVTQCLFIFYDAQVEYKQNLLGESNTLRRFTSAHPSVGTAMFTSEGVLLYANESFMTHLGIAKIREAKQKNIFSFFHITDQQFQKIVKIILSDEEHSEEFYGIEKDTEFALTFKGLVFGDKTIIEVILEDNSIFSQNTSNLDFETEELYEELKTARSVQEHILALPPIYRPGVSVDTMYLPSRQLSGDFFSVVPFENDQMGFLMADVSGHGVSASLITAALKILIQFAPSESDNLPKIIDYFNTYLADILPEGSFVTLFYGIVNFQDNSFRYINCGHPFPIFEDLSNNQIQKLESMGFPLGGLLNVSFDELVATISLPEKCRILFYTDGLFQHATGTIREKMDQVGTLMQNNKAINNKTFLDIVYKNLVTDHIPVPEDDVSMMLVSLDRTRTWKHKLSIASTILAVDTVIAEISNYIQKEVQLSTSTFWKIRTCLYETLLNAVVHGNKYNTQKRVFIDYRIYEDLITIRVRDEGAGFDHQNVKNPLEAENILTDFGRGIAMVHYLADHVRYNRKGNQISLFFIKGKK